MFDHPGGVAVQIKSPHYCTQGNLWTCLEHLLPPKKTKNISCLGLLATQELPPEERHERLKTLGEPERLGRLPERLKSLGPPQWTDGLWLAEDERVFSCCSWDSSMKLLGAPSTATRSKDATRGSWPYH